MVNATHLKVLLAKDFITLWRNRGFLIAFVVLPLGLMGLFIWLQTLVSDGTKSGSLIEEYANIVGTTPLDPSRSGLLRQCAIPNQAKYTFSKLAVIAEDETLR